MSPEAPAETQKGIKMEGLRLNRVILYVQDMKAQVDFYHEILGFDIAYPAESKDWSREDFIMIDAGPCTIALHSGGSGDFGSDTPLLSFQVDDVAAVRETLLKAGVKLGEIRKPAPGVQVCDGRDPDGNKLSFDQRDYSTNWGMR
jgi:catechol 2,3-dioxygenase-like lactoylglutathione lyase family enzyme